MIALDPTLRIARLERRVRHLTLVAGMACLGIVVVGLSAWLSPPQTTILRARQLVLEDEQGRGRVILGAPLPSLQQGGRELPARIGMVVNDSLGFERFGLTLRSNGSIGMGFDAPLGTGDDRNRERINIVADEDGGAYIRFLNRRTSVVGFLRLADDDQMWLEFVDVRPDTVVRRRIGFEGDETIARPR